MTDCTNAIYAKTKLNCHDQSDRVRYMMKTSKDNDVTEHIGLVYTKTEIELSRIIWSGVVCDEN